MRQLGNPLMSSAGLILKFLWDQGVATLPGGTTRGSEVDASSHAWKPGAKMVEGAVCCVVKMLASDTSRFNVRWHGCNQSLIGDHEPLPDNFEALDGYGFFGEQLVAHQTKTGAEKWTYHRLTTWVIKAKEKLADMGVTKKDRVMVFAAPCSCLNQDVIDKIRTVNSDITFMVLGLRKTPYGDFELEAFDQPTAELVVRFATEMRSEATRVMMGAFRNITGPPLLAIEPPVESIAPPATIEAQSVGPPAGPPSATIEAQSATIEAQSVGPPAGPPSVNVEAQPAGPPSVNVEAQPAGPPPANVEAQPADPPQSVVEVRAKKRMDSIKCHEHAQRCKAFGAVRCRFCRMEFCESALRKTFGVFPSDEMLGPGWRCWHCRDLCTRNGCVNKREGGLLAGAIAKKFGMMSKGNNHYHGLILQAREAGFPSVRAWAATNPHVSSW